VASLQNRDNTHNDTTNGVDGAVRAGPPSLQSAKSYSPLRKTAIARFTYGFSELPDLHIFDIKVKNKRGADINSKKLRYREIREFLSLSDFDKWKPRGAINVDHKKPSLHVVQSKDRVDHIIFPLRGDIDLKDITARLETQPIEVVLKDTKLVIKYGTLEEIICKISNPGKRISHNDEPYKRSFDLLLRTLSTFNLGEDRVRSLYHVENDFIEPLPRKDPDP
jgi:hypothetical protein